MELTLDQALQQGIAAHREGKLQDAERLYRAILQTQPNHPDANHNLGVLAVAVGKPLEALPLFQQALDANPQIEQFWLSYIDALIKVERLDEAKRVLAEGERSGVSLDKLDAIKQRLKGGSSGAEPPQDQLNHLLALYKAGKLETAEEFAKLLTQQFPKHLFGWKVLGAVYQQTGRLGESLAAKQKSVELSPQDAEAHSNLGNTLEELGRLDEAEASLRQAIALKPDYAEAHNNLGNTLQELGSLGEAEASLRQAIALKPDYAEAHNNLGNTLQELGRLDGAEASYRKAIALKPDNAKTHSNLGVALQALGRLDDAEASYRKAIALKPDYADPHLNLCETLEQTNAIDTLLLALEDAEKKTHTMKADFLYYRALDSCEPNNGG
jgi:tetratricopeptide (TPR) repeat protein